MIEAVWDQQKAQFDQATASGVLWARQLMDKGLDPIVAWTGMAQVIDEDSGVDRINLAWLLAAAYVRIAQDRR